jgi:hypothetical protein
MSSHVKWFLTAFLAALMVAPALGELILDLTPLPEDDPETSPLLLTNKGVQKELHLTDEQRDKITKIIHDALVKRLPDIQKATQKAITSGDRKILAKVIREGMQKATLEAHAEVNKAIPDILKKEQIKRLRQIELQVNVLSSLNRPDIQKELKLTDKQKAEVKKKAADCKRDIAEAEAKSWAADERLEPSARDRKAVEMAQATRKLIDAANRKAVEIFTEEQKRIWKDMTGEKFDFKLDVLNFPRVRPQK